MTLTTIGYGDVSPVNTGEMAFMVVSMLLGAAVFSFVVGTCCSLVEGLDKMGLAFQEDYDAINDYCEICNIPTTMRRRVRSYISNTRELANRKNERDILKLLSPALQVLVQLARCVSIQMSTSHPVADFLELPLLPTSPLQREFMLHNYSSIIRACKPLAGAPDNFVVAMAQFAERRIFGPGDVISNQGAKDEPFFVLTSGEVLLCRTYVPGEPLHFDKRMRGSGFWNGRLLVYDSYADCSSKAVSFVELAAFASVELRKLLHKYPQGCMRVKQVVIRRLWKFAAAHILRKTKDEMSCEGAAVEDVNGKCSDIRLQNLLVGEGGRGGLSTTMTASETPVIKQTPLGGADL